MAQITTSMLLVHRSRIDLGSIYLLNEAPKYDAGYSLV